MPTNMELEKKVDALEKELADAQGAIRRLSERLNQDITLIAKLTEEVTNLKTEVKKVQAAQAAAKSQYSAGINRYE